jgi:ATP-dependent Clp protease protease subunit
MSLRKLPEVKAFKAPTTISFEPSEGEIEAFDNTIRAAADEEPGVISLYGQIGLDPWTDTDNSERRIAAALRSLGKRDISVNINSPGGNFFSGLAIYNLLRAHPAKVTVNVLAMAGSAASIVAMAGDEVLMADGSFLMVHNASGVVIGNKHDLKDTAEILSEVDDSMAEIYAARAGVEKREALAWMDRRRGDGTMFNATAAVERGLADGKLPPGSVKIAADASKDLPAERVVERALALAGNKTRAESRSLIAALKGNKPDAVADAMPDAGEIAAEILRLASTIAPKG